jgi:predicted branched-subunit amino acid permease
MKGRAKRPAFSFPRMTRLQAGALLAAGGHDTQARAPMPISRTYPSATAAFLAGLRSALTSVFVLVLAGTYVGIGALAHNFGLAPWWLALSTVLIFAAPAQVILVTALGAGSPLVEVGIAVTLSAIRLFPMVVALLPLLRNAKTPTRDLLIPTHFTSVSMWVESLRILPSVAFERRIPFCNGLSAGYCGTAVLFGFVGSFLAAGLPTLLAGALLFLTPMSFLISTSRNARAAIDKLALVFGLIIGPLLVYYQIGLDLMWTGIAAGTLAYTVHRVTGARA